MNTELLREDERPNYPGGESATEHFLRQRLIEEREKERMARTTCNDNYDWAKREQKRAEKAEAELAEARKDSARLDWALERAGVSMCRNSVTWWLHNRASIDAAMKEGK